MKDKKYLRELILNASEAQVMLVLFVLQIFNARRTIVRSFKASINWLYYRELYIFPPVAFVADYTWMNRIFPHHPVSEMAILATAFMSMTLTLFILRPPKRMKAHWVKP